VGARQLIQRAARGRSDAALTEPRAARARWAVRAGRHQLTVTMLH
jgi:hypothetical protein